MLRVWVIGLGLTLASCSGASGAVIKPVATPLVCGDAAVLGTYPSDNTWHGAIVGPLFFSAFGPGKERAVIDDFDARSPTKVVIQPLDPLKARVKLQGWRCSTGDQLRFEYGASWNTPVAVLPPAGGRAERNTGGVHRVHALHRSGQVEALRYRRQWAAARHSDFRGPGQGLTLRSGFGFSWCPS